jgi:hypothetical protein
MTRLRCRSSSQHFGNASNASSACTWGAVATIVLLLLIATTALGKPMLAIDCIKPTVPVDMLGRADAAHRAQPCDCGAVRRGGGGRCRRPVLCRVRGVRSTCAPGARKDGQTRTLQQAVECVGKAYGERSRGLDSPLGIAGALVLQGGVHRWRQLRMTETSRYPLRRQTRPERARCDGFDRFYEIHLFKTA